MRVWLTQALILGVVATSASAQEIPAGAYSRAGGPVELCGLSAANVAELAASARVSSELRLAHSDARFEMYASADHHSQLTFTRQTEPAYPAATCRRIVRRDGSLYTDRQMRCEAGKAECDALFLEFHRLDQQLRDYIQRRY